jgi:hypothetical protein
LLGNFPQFFQVVVNGAVVFDGLNREQEPWFNLLESAENTLERRET